MSESDVRKKLERFEASVENRTADGDGYEAAMARALAREPRQMVWVDDHKPTREELHDRAGVC